MITNLSVAFMSLPTQEAKEAFKSTEIDPIINPFKYSNLSLESII